jgi:Chaperone for flagella basal body P-ring formation
MMGQISMSVLGVVLATVSLAGSAQSPPATITPQQVAVALLVKHISVSDEEVSLPSRVPAKTTNPLLEVISVSSTLQNDTLVKLRCVDGRDCLPFYAVIAGARGKPLEKGLRPPPAAAPHLPAPPPPPEPWLVRSGERATLVLEGKHLRVQMPVVCLANGSAGASIRVISSNGKQTYRVQVAAAGLLKGGL